MGLIEVAGPRVEPLHLTDAKLHLRIDTSDEDRTINASILAARRYVEAATGLALVVRQFQQTLDDFPDSDSDPILLEQSPLSKFGSITYLDGDGNTQTLSSASYDVDTTREPARIMLAPDQSWPDTEDERINTVTLTYHAGYVTPFSVDTSTDIFTSLERTFVNDDRVQFTNTGGAIPAGLTAGITYYVIEASGSTFKVSTSSGGSKLDVTDTGTGTSFIGEVPGEALAAMRLLLGNWDEYRSNIERGGAVELTGSGAVKSLTNMLRVWRFA